jgi:hypothetical protein
MLIMAICLLAVILLIGFLLIPIYTITSYAERCPSHIACSVITIFVDGVREIQDPDPSPFQGDGDYYPAVKIGRDAFQSFREECMEGEVLDTAGLQGWVFATTLPDDRPNRIVTITIRLLDADDEPFAAQPLDDLIDINPVDGRQDIILRFNMDSMTWTSNGLSSMATSAEGDGDIGNLFQFIEGGEAAGISFDIIISRSGLANDLILNPVPQDLANCK